MKSIASSGRERAFSVFTNGINQQCSAAKTLEVLTYLCEHAHANPNQRVYLVLKNTTSNLRLDLVLTAQHIFFSQLSLSKAQNPVAERSPLDVLYNPCR